MFAFKLSCGYSRRPLWLMAVQPLISAIFPLVMVVFSAKIVDSVEAGMPVKELFVLIVTAVCINALMFALSKIMERAMRIACQHYRNYEQRIFHKKMTEIDFELLENADFQKNVEAYKNVLENSGGNIVSFWTSITNIMHGIWGLIFSLISIAPILKSIFVIDNSSFMTSWKPLVMLLVSVAAVAAAMLIINDSAGKRFASLNAEIYRTFGQFRYWYGTFYENYKMGKDVRIFRSRELLKKELNKYFNSEYEMFNIFEKKQRNVNASTAALQYVLMGILYFFIAAKAWSGAFSIGNLVLFIGAADIIANAIGGITALPYLISTLAVQIDTFKKIIEQKPVKYVGRLPIEKRDDNRYDIEFKNVSFKYPGTEKYVLKNFSAKLHIGSHMAVVGMNGSGKTTFIKLLCRLYDPDEGEITLNGIDIKKYNLQEYMTIFSVVFQDFTLFSVPLCQNVTTSLEVDDKKMWDCLEKAGIADRVKKLPQKEHTVLYKDFDENGVEISGGEAQKIALARALYKDAPFVILDEPTAALDPISEYEIYKRFNEFVGDKTAVYISHRLSSCRFCENIIVFDKGEIVQRGSHDELLAEEGGKYYQLWNAQAQYYA